MIGQIGSHCIAKVPRWSWYLLSRTNSWTLELRWESTTLRNSFLRKMTRTISCIHARPGIPPSKTVHSIVQNRVGTRYGAIQQWCSEDAWFNSSPECDFWVADTSQYRWGLPILVSTCPKKMFMQGPRLKYIDIVTDTLHASSSDLITRNTLVMMKLKWFDLIPRKWLDIPTHSLKAWEERDQLSQFHSDPCQPIPL